MDRVEVGLVEGRKRGGPRLAVRVEFVGLREEEGGERLESKRERGEVRKKEKKKRKAHL